MNVEDLAMKKKELNKTLREIVLQYGIERVDQALLEIRKTADGRPHRSSSSVACSKSRSKPDSDKHRKAKITATGFVLKLEVSSEARCLLEELATKYENKEFLPTVGEIRNFCEIHGIDVPNSLSRVAAVPRVFKYLSQLDFQEIQSMLQSNSFSGPARLGPIAEAIRRTSKQRTNNFPRFDSTNNSAWEKKRTKGEKRSKPRITSKI